MALRTEEKLETGYICGQCGLEQYHLISEEPPIPCIDCSYGHKDHRKFDVPTEFPYRFSQTGGNNINADAGWGGGGWGSQPWGT